MALLYSDDYKTLRDSIKGNRPNPEERWTNRLFLFGLIVEALAIIYTIGFSINLSKNPDKKLYFYQSLTGFRICIYLLTLLSLLIHQSYIRNNLKEINAVTSEKYKEDNPSEIFPDNLMFSKAEYFLRNCYFILLAVIAGEIPYFFMIGEKIWVQIEDKHDYMIYGFSTKIFLFSCFLLCLIVLLWDLLLYFSFKRLQKRSTIPIKFDENKIRTFIVSDFLSLGLWVCICLFTLTQNNFWIDDLLFGFALVYSFIIIGLRLIFKKTNVKTSF